MGTYYLCTHVLTNNFILPREKEKGNFLANYSKPSTSMFDVTVHLWFVVLPNDTYISAKCLDSRTFSWKRRNKEQRFLFKILILVFPLEKSQSLLFSPTK